MSRRHTHSMAASDACAPVLLPHWKYTDGLKTSASSTEPAVERLSHLARAYCDEVFASVFVFVVQRQPGPSELHPAIATFLTEQSKQGRASSSPSAALEADCVSPPEHADEYMTRVHGMLEALYAGVLSARPASATAAKEELLKLVDKAARGN